MQLRIRQIAVGFCIALMLAVCGESRAAGPSGPIDESAFTGKIKLAAVGDSITLGATTTPARGLPNAYPAQLQRMLGDKYEVKNFGVSGRTLMSKGDRPYVKEKKYQASLDYKPDVVVIMLGTNDTKTPPNNWQHKAEFAGDYKALIEKYAALESKPRIFVCRTCFVANEGFGSINEPAILEQLPIIDALAKEMKLGLVPKKFLLGTDRNQAQSINLKLEQLWEQLIAATGQRNIERRKEHESRQCLRPLQIPSAGSSSRRR